MTEQIKQLINRMIYHSFRLALKPAAMIGCFAAIFLLLLFNGSASALAQEIQIDAVVASVDGKPITLSEISSKLPGSNSLTLNEVAQNEQARQILESLILRRLIESEASTKGITVSAEELDEYIDSVAQRNKLTTPQLKEALIAQKSDWEEYREYVRFEILKSKLAASFVRGQVTISDKEVEKHLKARPELLRQGAKVKVRQILLNSAKYTPEGAAALLEQIRTQLAAGANFGKLAAEHSDAPEAAEGGQLGVFAEADLNPVILEAIASLNPGEVSQVTQTRLGWHLFQLEDRFGQDVVSKDKIREEVRSLLQQQQFEAKMNSYIREELPKNHVIERKL